MKLEWYHGEDYEEQANRQGYTLGRMGKEFNRRYVEIHDDFIFGYGTYIQYIAALKKLEKDLNRYAETRFSAKARSSQLESCYLDQGITQC